MVFPAKLDRFGDDIPLLIFFVKNLPQPQQPVRRVRPGQEIKLAVIELDADAGPISGIATPLAKQVVLRAKAADINAVRHGFTEELLQALQIWKLSWLGRLLSRFESFRDDVLTMRHFLVVV